MEGDVHKRLKKLALHWLKEKMTDLVANEAKLFVRRKKLVPDAVGLNFRRKEVRYVEVKTSKADLVRDKLLFEEGHSYARLGNYAYILSPEGVLSESDLPEGYGWLVCDEYGNLSVKKNPKANKAPGVKFDTVLKRAARALTNAHLFHEENKELKDHTEGKFQRGAVLHLVAATCPSCKKRDKYLIRIGEKAALCQKKGCKAEIDLEKARPRVVSGFNKTFLEKIEELKKAP